MNETRDTPDPNTHHLTLPDQSATETSDSPQVHTPASIGSELRQSVSKAQVIQGSERFKLVDNALWTRIVEELHTPQDALDDSVDETNAWEAANADSDFVLGNYANSPTPCHPQPEDIRKLWQIFIENIDPLTKVLHIPTLHPAMESAMNDIEAAPRGLEALMFAIYSAAVMSLTDNECQEKLHGSRKVLLLRYISATRAALSRVNFMGTTSLLVLQALVIHLLAVRDVCEPRAVWSLTGVAVRIAQSMGLDRDGASLGLPPFETEIRRRIWWQLKMHDFRTAELCGIRKFQDLQTGAEYTKWPSNIDDCELYPAMSTLADSSGRLTDAVFICLKCELLRHAAECASKLRQQGQTSSPWDALVPGSDVAEADKSTQEIEELLETKYLRYCDPSQPLHLITMLMARCSLNIIRFMSHHPRRWAGREQTPPSERQWVWELCIRLLEQHNMLQSNILLKQYAWHAPYFQQWHAVIHVLDTLRADPLIADAQRAWKYLGNLYETNSDLITDMTKPIHIAVGSLCLKAYANRKAALQSRNMQPPPMPQFISELHQSLGPLKARRQEVTLGSDGSRHLAAHGQTGDPGEDLKGGSNSDNDADHNPSSASVANHHIASSPTSEVAVGDAPFSSRQEHSSFMSGLEDSQNGRIDTAPFDAGFIFDEDFGAGDCNTYTVSWDQWDAWLADSNAAPFDFATELPRLTRLE